MTDDGSEKLPPRPPGNSDAQIKNKDAYDLVTNAMRILRDDMKNLPTKEDAERIERKLDELIKHTGDYLSHTEGSLHHHTVAKVGKVVHVPRHRYPCPPWWEW